MSAARAARALALAGLAALVCGAPARAQHDEAAPGVADVPAGPAAIRGRVVHGEDPALAAGVEVMLYALPAGGAPGVRRATSGADGAFAFEGVSNDPQTAYLVGARHQGVPYPGARVVFAEGQTEHGGIEVRIGEATPDPAQVSVRELELRVGPRSGRLAVLELYRFENAGARTVYVPADARAGARPAFRSELPAGADEFHVPLGLAPEGLVRDGADVRFYGPVYPSAWEGPAARDQGLSFEYLLPAGEDGAVALRKRVLSGAGRVVVLAPADLPAPGVPPGARDEGELEIEGRRWRRFVYEGVAPGRELALAFQVPPARVDPAAVRLEESRIFLELDDAALLVREELRLTVSGDAPVVGAPGRPLLVLHVPEGAADLRFDRALFERGLRPGDGEGEAVLDGPLPPGESSIEIAYHLPVTDPDAGAVFARRFDRKLPLLSIFVADTGLRYGSERLHRRRPVATPDRTYMHLEAFEVTPDETVSLSLAQLQAPGGLPRAVRYGLVALAAAGAVAFLGGPLRREDGAAGGEPERLDDPVEDAARSERDAVYAALRDLEHDHETAKVSDADYAVMRQELRARAAALLRAEGEAERRVPAARATHAAPPAPEAPACRACGAAARAGDRVCARCGAALEQDPAREASA
jgi:hypothetical protein